MYFILMIFGSFVGEELHTGLWMFKVLLHTALLVCSMYMPASAFSTWSGIAVYGSALFLVLMVVVLIDFAYSRHEDLVRRIEEEDEEAAASGWETQGTDGKSGCCCCTVSWKFVYIAVCTVLVLLALGVLFWLFAYSSNQEVYCGWNLGVLSITLVAGVTFTVLSATACLSPSGQSKGLLPPAIVLLYCVWLTWSAIHSNPTRACDPWHSQDSDSTSIVGIAIALFTLGYAAFSATSSLPTVFDSPPARVAQPVVGEEPSATAGASAKAAPDNVLLDNHSNGSAGVGDDPESVRVADAAYRQGADGDDSAPPKQVVTPYVFHIVMFLAAVYMAMLLTNWNRANTSIASRHTEGNFYVNAVSCWLAIVLYMWTLLAERACPNRQFS